MASGIITRLRSALDRIESIGNQIAGRTLAEARDDRMFQLGLERQFSQLETILGRILERDPALVEVMPFAPSVVEMGITIIRDYDTLNYDAIWTITVRDLPMLAEQIGVVIATYIESPLPVEGRGEPIPLVAARRPELIELCHEFGEGCWCSGPPSTAHSTLIAAISTRRRPWRLRVRCLPSLHWVHRRP